MHVDGWRGRVGLAGHDKLCLAPFAAQRSRIGEKKNRVSHKKGEKEKVFLIFLPPSGLTINSWRGCCSVLQVSDGLGLLPARHFGISPALVYN